MSLPISGKISLDDVRKELNKSSITELRPEKCTYYFTSYDTFYAQRNDIVNRHNGNLSKVTIGFSDNVTTLFEGFRNTTITHTPKAIIGKNISDVSNLFGRCESLVYIEESLFKGCPNIKNINNIFTSCRSLKLVPFALFDKCRKITHCMYSFMNAGDIITSVPDLWNTEKFPCLSYGASYISSNNSTIINYNEIPSNMGGGGPSYTYPNGQISEGGKSLITMNDKDVRTLANIMNGTIKMSDFYGKNYTAGQEVDYYFPTKKDYEWRLQSIVDNYNGDLSEVTFGFNPSSYSLTLQTEMLKQNIRRSPKTIYAAKCESIAIFQNSKTIEYVSETLFDGCPNLTSIAYCFSYAEKLKELPPRLLSKLTKLKSISHAFQGCKALVSIPDGFFNNNSLLENVSLGFARCQNLKHVPYNLFNNQIIIHDSNTCFYNDSAIVDRLPPVWKLNPYGNHKSYGYNCINAPNYNDMPESCKSQY